jgi:hypothetical protein
MLAANLPKLVRNPAVEQFLEERKNDFHCTLQDLVVKGAQAMFWRIVVWVAAVEVLVCLVPFELTGIVSLLHLWHVVG